MIGKKTLTAFAVLMICSFFFLPQSSFAAVLRGRLVWRVNGMPAGGLTVTTYNAALGRSLPYVTGGDGMYYMNIPQGGYYLEVWGVANAPQPLVYPIQVSEPGSDIPPILVP